MAQRQIGQEGFGFIPLRGSHSSLDELESLIDWHPIATVLGEIHAAAKGEPAWPPLALFKAMLIAVWYDLSDVKLAEALDDLASFRRFCGFAAQEPTPERTAFVRLRRQLVACELDQVLFAEVTEQLKAKAVKVKTGTLVDATVITSASEQDEEARWSGHQRRRAIHGYKAHVGADGDTAIVERVSVTPGNAHDGRSGEGALPDKPGTVFADSAYRGQLFAAAVRIRGGVPHVAQSSIWAHEDDRTAVRRLRDWNNSIHRVRCRIEKVFGTWKRSYGLRRMRWRGLAKAALQVCLTAMAYNLKRTATIMRPASS
ncbi:IS5 family transposase [Roseomonas marmotae]|uniref:IS5 family transposase n=1 Tax=Roseomonas marmotae TaxID=2768161 RepID=A0ABS3KHV9_9PROT|nr:IS5 family transposase [Roseomonas marmotae]MBO1077047.1 IS5 family transposase [Roseomonas marmotae]QTI82116.1 IS5 family transposase [Roseomonas marmotae]